jgi:hypothetical protein
MYAVIFYAFKPLKISGATINALEYFFGILEHNSEIKFVIVNGDETTKKELINLAENRYYLEDLDYKNNIICISNPALIRHKFDKALVVDFEAIYRTKYTLNARKIIVIQEKLGHNDIVDYGTDRKYFDKIGYEKTDYQDVVIYGEMPYQAVDHKYRMKMLFSRYKKLNFSTPGYYINSPKNNNFNFLKTLNLDEKPHIYKDRIHLNNMFEYFDEYIYWHAGLWFDPSPRLFHECYFYDKKIHYPNFPVWKDGSYYRWIDVMLYGIKDRYITKNDEIIKEFI